ncbi:MAG TPA: response regulator transcription factor [Candidatus Sulfotelmatobacter sp.]|nr:response regulator transcription factor [Candidatus Sulfotelmatobacter sp.]
MGTKRKDKKKSEDALLRRRILVVDDHPVMREGVVRWIRHAADMEVCGEAESVPDAISLVKKSKPDLVLTDISLKVNDGLELIKSLQATNPELPVLVLSMHSELLYARSALRAGARGYVMKKDGGERVVEAIREIFQGHIAISPKIRAQLPKSLLK